MSDSSAPRLIAPRPIAIANWLFALAFMVFMMVVIGGITRLTESGLSITEWKPVTGAIPPLNDDDWREAFAAYQQTTQWQEVTGPAGMTLSGFKFIFFWEWAHRFLGRLIGLAFALPFLWFWVKKQIPAGYVPRLLALFALGGAQGALGWYMVQSGLVGRTEVSHFRLAAHLMLALFTMAGLIWTALDLRALKKGREGPARLDGFAALVLSGLALQILLGAWVAGLRAGQVSNTWPLMNDYLLPEGIDASKGAWFALTHDPYLIHFLHRWWAWGVVVLLILLARKVKKVERRASIAIHSTFGTQIILGIATVLTGVGIVWAVLHQAVGALVVAATVWGAHNLGRRESAS